MAQNEGPRQENTQQPIRDSFLKHSGPSILHAQKACFACRRCGGAAGCELPPFGPSPTCLVERDQKPGGGPKKQFDCQVHPNWTRCAQRSTPKHRNGGGVWIGALEPGSLFPQVSLSILFFSETPSNEAIGFGLGMLFAAAIWGCVSWRWGEQQRTLAKLRLFVRYRDV